VSLSFLHNSHHCYCGVNITGAFYIGAPRYKPGGRAFYSRGCHWNFSLTALWSWGLLSL
jgi:hypothetical protein